MFNFFKKENPENIDELLSQFKGLKKEFKKISKELNALKESGKIPVQKIGVIRFNPFKEAGGNQSFSIALLNANDDGVVITNLYGRDGSRAFAKSIKDSLSEYPLSQEEKEAIEQAKISNIQLNGENK